MSERKLPAYIRLCTLHRVVDGDTLDLMVDLGFKRYSRERIRLMGVDTPETHGETREAGDAATAFVIEWCKTCELPLVLESHKKDSFGRWLGSLYRQEEGGVMGESLADALLAAGHACEYRKD
jgi:micrococcal nuclease